MPHMILFSRCMVCNTKTLNVSDNLLLHIKHHHSKVEHMKINMEGRNVLPQEQTTLGSREMVKIKKEVLEEPRLKKEIEETEADD